MSKPLIFEPTDFQDPDVSYLAQWCVLAAEKAQARFDLWLESQQVVYASDEQCWGPLGGDVPDTHKARIVCIEKLEPKVCEHEPRYEAHMQGKPLYPIETSCVRCHVKLKATWTAE